MKVFRCMAVTVVALALPLTMSLPGEALTERARVSATDDLSWTSVPVREGPPATSRVTKGTGEPIALTSSEIYTLQGVARDTGQNLQDVLANHAGAAQFMELATLLETKLPENYSRAGLAGGSQRSNWIQFRVEPPQWVIDQIGLLPMDVEIITGAPASWTELEKTAASLTEVVGQTPALKSAGTRYDPVQGVTWFEYEPTPGANEEAVEFGLAKVFAAAASQSARDELPLPVIPVEANGATSLEVTVSGGRRMDFDAGGLACTLGFTAVRNGQRGVLTADHCPNNGDYQGTEGVISEAPTQGSPGFGSADTQWHLTLAGHSTNRQFRADAGVDWSVTGVANAVMRAGVCHFGHGTGAMRCSSIDAVNECHFIPDYGNSCGLDLVYNDISAGGDSGGPWFNGGTAHGTHAAIVNGRSAFVRVGRVQDVLGVTVLQN